MRVVFNKKRPRPLTSVDLTHAAKNAKIDILRRAVNDNNGSASDRKQKIKGILSKLGVEDMHLEAGYTKAVDASPLTEEGAEDYVDDLIDDLLTTALTVSRVSRDLWAPLTHCEVTPRVIIQNQNKSTVQ